MVATQPAPPAARARPRRWVRIALVLGTLALGVGIIAAVPWLRHAVVLCLHGDVTGLRHYIRSLGAGGLALLVALMVMHALVYYPTELVTATTGFVYGWLPGTAIALGGWMLSAWASYGLGRLLAGPLLRALLGDRYASFERAMHRGGRELLLGYRLLPVVPFSFMGYAAGAAGTPLWEFTWTTAVGYLPLTAAVAYLGSRAQSLSLTDPLVWGIVAALLAALLGAHRLARTRSPARRVVSSPGGADDHRHAEEQP